ncbi:sulfite exporter TauE/SafE family protein [Desulfoluna spongiiphila]|uniref:sulfite exporter TauE/SafE family protein n=1 Tax=Desulfoluna spongiiphila TaxID=419481 RepID=UPI001255E9A2|nr:sulfite exporter TauE/SafE family protein [Desulfoluna spongiiphila]VVS92379.1 transmembrane protein taue-like [Desulfoluna spongiiphila]
MDHLTLVVSVISFGLSFLFALGGVGSALVLIPTLTWLGIPFAQARPTALFVNTVSMLGATVSNIREKRLDIRLGVPIIAASVLLAPLGAWVSHRIPTRIVLMVFVGFLAFSGSMMLFFKGSKYADQYREDRPVAGPLLVGALAGFFSGLLGVGGGGLISPLMMAQGFNPKRIAAVTAFAVPFSSFSAFLAYAAMGSVSLRILACAGLAAWAGGYLGTRVMQRNMKASSVKKCLGVVLLLLAVRLSMKLM